MTFFASGDTRHFHAMFHHYLFDSISESLGRVGPIWWGYIREQRPLWSKGRLPNFIVCLYAFINGRTQSAKHDCNQPDEKLTVPV
jgi:hypothetical protein